MKLYEVKFCNINQVNDVILTSLSSSNSGLDVKKNGKKLNLEICKIKL